MRPWDSLARSASNDESESGPPPPHWLAVWTRSRHEFQVRDQMRAAGMEEFLPTRTVESRWSDRIQQTTWPLFPGYIFARAHPARFHGIRGVTGVLGRVTDSEMADLRRVMESPAPVLLCPHVIDERVRIERGPFAGVTGIVRRIKGQTRLIVAIEVMRSAVSVEIDAKDITITAKK